MNGKWIRCRDGSLVNLNMVSQIYVYEPYGTYTVQVRADIGTGTGEQANGIPIREFKFVNSTRQDQDRAAARVKAEAMLLMLCGELQAITWRGEE